MTSWLVYKCDACGKESREPMFSIQFYRVPHINSAEACSIDCAAVVLRKVADELAKIERVNKEGEVQP